MHEIIQKYAIPNNHRSRERGREIHSFIHSFNQRERERERQTQRERERERERDDLNLNQLSLEMDLDTLASTPSQCPVGHHCL
jgi:RNA-binding protein 25